MRGLGLFAGLAALAACSTAPGTGWSRAPDLSVYSAMSLFGDVAREQAALCRGFPPSRVAREWEEDFAGREAAVEAALAARYGADAVAAAEERAVASRTVACPDVPNRKWREEFVRLMRLLEGRLGLA